MAQVALRGAAAAPDKAGTPPAEPSTTRPTPPSHTASASSTSTASSYLSATGTHNGTSRITKTGSGKLTVDVALKMIPKKKVKGNESSVWGEMEVLKGLDHSNIVSLV